MPLIIPTRFYQPRGAFDPAPGGGGSYTGPGDVSGWSGAYAAWGLRAYNAAFAATEGALIQIVDQDGNHPTDIHCGTDGQIKLSEIAAFKTAWLSSTILVSKLYDMSGFNRHLDTNPNALKPVLTENAINTTLPVVSFADSHHLCSTLNATAQAQPITIGTIIKITGHGVTFTDGTFGFDPLVRIPGNARGQEAGGSRRDYTGTDGAWESIQSIMNGASSSMRINNVNDALGDPGSNGIASTNKLTMGGTDGGAALMDGDFFEWIIIPGAVSGADQTALYNNADAAGLV